ncbi:MAG: alpha/beta fold hydrolase [Desulfobacterales bacterium]|nr:alpha/beta fold hydrolase [Desulfobacterales bacterium]
MIANDAYRHLYPFRSRYANIGGFRYHYLDEGTGEPVVMLHGNPTWSFYYRHLVKTLAPTCRTIVPDHIGCGYSEKPPANRYPYRLARRVTDFELLLDNLGIDRNVTLIVHDWGGMIGLVWALRHVDRLKRLVITNTSGFLPPGGKALPRRLKLIRNLSAFGAPAVIYGNLFARAALFMAPRRRLARDVRRGLVAPYDSPPNRIATLKFVQDIPLGPHDPSYALVASVDADLARLASIPMLILWGLHDFVFDRDYLAEWQRRFPQAEVHTFPTAGHYLLEDEPQAVGAIVRQFFRSHPVAADGPQGAPNNG